MALWVNNYDDNERERLVLVPFQAPFVIYQYTNMIPSSVFITIIIKLNGPLVDSFITQACYSLGS